MAANDEFIDTETYLGLKEIGDSEFLQDLFGTFLSDTKIKLQELSQAIENQNIQTMLETAHSLKGSSGNVGAQTLSAVAAQLQYLGEQKSFENAETLLQQCQLEFDRVEQFLKADIETLT